MTGPSRRALLAGALAAGSAAASAAAAAEVAPAADPDETVKLWPGPPPGAPADPPRTLIVDRAETSGFQDRSVSQIGEPLVTVFRPARPNGAGILVLPGGGYVRVVIDKEGFETARRWNAAGITAFVLRYRLPAEGWANPADTPLQDAQRALRLIRANAAAYGVDPGRIAVMGFSAGGHLAASLCTRFDASVYAPVDAADTASARPDLAMLGYPVMLMSGPLAHAGSAHALLGADASAERAAAYSPNLHVSAAMPPTFMIHAADDTTVPLDNSLAYAAALRTARVPVEMHVFEEGGHGFGIFLARGKPAAAWPDLFLAWARRHDFYG
jgi:acetyl esterase/lipase